MIDKSITKKLQENGEKYLLVVEKTVYDIDNAYPKIDISSCTDVKCICLMLAAVIDLQQKKHADINILETVILAIQAVQNSSTYISKEN